MVRKEVIEKWKKIGLLEGLPDYKKEERAKLLEEAINDPSLFVTEVEGSATYEKYDKRIDEILEITKPSFNFDTIKNFNFKTIWKK
jgi:hypothetical protein